MYKRLIRIGFILMLAFVVVACGGGSDEADGSSEDAAVVETVEVTEVVPEIIGDVAHGEEIYMTSCIACHGPDAKGVPGLGKSLHAGDSEYMRTQSDEALVEFILVGRQPDDPLNSTGVAMPPKGGNPAMTESDVINVVSYLRTLDE